MNISSKSWMIHGPEQAYHNIRPKMNPKSARSADIAAQDVKAANRLNQASLNPLDILSLREKDTLQALFGNKNETHSFYGGTRVKNIQAGYLLDIKG